MKKVFTLCAGRHETPCDNYIFGEIADPTDFVGMYNAANAAIPDGTESVDVYVTGLTPALLAVVQVCQDRAITMTALHYDRNSGKYLPQVITTFFQCPVCGRRIWGTPYNHASYCPHCGAS